MKTAAPWPVLALAAVVSPACAADSPAQHYVNARFGFSAEVPAGFAAQEPPPDNGDGRIFHPATPGVTLTLSAIGDVTGDTMASWMKDDTAACLPGPRYLDVHAGWAVLSCVTTDGILYQRSILTGHGDGAMVTTARMTYPANQRSRWDAVAVQVTRSLHPAPAR